MVKGDVKIVLKTLNHHSSTMLPHNIKVFVMCWKVISKIVFNMSIFWNLQKNMYSFHTFSTQFKKYMKNPLSYFFKPVHNKRISPLVGAPWRPRAAAVPPPRRRATAELVQDTNMLEHAQYTCYYPFVFFPGYFEVNGSKRVDHVLYSHICNYVYYKINKNSFVCQKDKDCNHQPV